MIVCYDIICNLLKLIVNFSDKNFINLCRFLC